MLKWVRRLAIVVAVLTVAMVGAFFAYAQDIPDPDKINSRLIVESTKIFDRNGALLYEVHGEVKRTLISFEEMPESIKGATVVVEDESFYKHRGINFKGILRAAFEDITSVSLSQGGSSITQQLVKNALLTREKSFARKIKEVILAVKIEQQLSKEDILKLYLNEIPYGQNAYGIEAAAQTYFGKHSKDLTLAESVYLAALPQKPSYFNPFGPHREELDARKNFILDKMVNFGYATEEEAEQAKQQEVEFQQIKTGIKAPHFVFYVQDILEQQYGKEALEKNGLQVATTLDYELQKKAEEAIAENIDRLERYGATNAGLVAIDPSTGEILAMVGSKDFWDQENQGQVNIAVRERQPGSSFKPYVYATAFKQGMGPATVLMDVETSFGTVNGKPYIPKNHDGSQSGPVSIRNALAGSLNIPAVKTLYLVGINNAINTAQEMGITSSLSASNCGLSLVLGGCEVKLLDHTAAFSVFANQGVKQETKAVLEIKGNKGDVVYEVSEDEGEQVINREVAYLISDILSDNNARAAVFGQNNSLTLPNRPAAAKTGTTQNFKDAWTVGYTPQIAVGVWAGNMNGDEMREGAYGSSVAGPIWNSFMRKIHEGEPVQNFSKPSNIVELEVDKMSGLLPTKATYESRDGTLVEKFASFAVPTQYDNVHKYVKINSENGKLATTDTPESLVVDKLYTILHSQRPENMDWEKPARTWTITHGFTYPPSEKDGNGEVLKVEQSEYLVDNGQENLEDEYPLYISEPNSGQIIIDSLDIVVKSEEFIEENALHLYLRDSNGLSYEITADVSIDRSSNETVYRMVWQPTINIANGSYALFASTDKGVKSNLVNIEIKKE